MKNILIIFFLVCHVLVYGQIDSLQINQPQGSENLNAIDDLWEVNEKTFSNKCKTLILRDECDYCLGEKSYYAPVKFNNTTSCLCYRTCFVPKINEFINSRCNEIKEIIIENPSNIIFELNYKNLNKLEEITLFGNDFDVLKSLPADLLSLPNMKKIIFKVVQIPESEIEMIRMEFPKIKIVGNVSEL